MNLLIFSVYDAAVKAYLRPFYARSKGEAVRQFTDAANDEKSEFSKHAHDYCLVYLGEFDDNLGSFNSVNPERIISAHECIDDNIFPPDKKVS